MNVKYIVVTLLSIPGKVYSRVFIQILLEETE